VAGGCRGAAPHLQLLLVVHVPGDVTPVGLAGHLGVRKAGGGGVEVEARVGRHGGHDRRGQLALHPAHVGQRCVAGVAGPAPYRLAGVGRVVGHGEVGRAAVVVQVGGGGLLGLLLQVAVARVVPATRGIGCSTGWPCRPTQRPAGTRVGDAGAPAFAACMQLPGCARRGHRHRWRRLTGPRS
jgi:hypothetical protein